MPNHFQSTKNFSEESRKNILKVNLKDNVKNRCKMLKNLGTGIKIMAQFRSFVYVPIFEQIFLIFQG